MEEIEAAESTLLTEGNGDEEETIENEEDDALDDDGRHCIDYSKNMIDVMITKQKEEAATQQATLSKKTASSSSSSIELVYKVADARKLPCPSLSFDLLLEKGTLDAMLSDSKEGAKNCRCIVAECARVMSAGGCLMVFSHINAHVQSGLE